MSNIKKIIKGDIVKILSGKDKGTTGKVVKVMAKKQSILVEGVGNIHRKVKASAQNPRGGQKDIHVPTPIHKVALVIDEKTGKTSRIGMNIDTEGKKIRVARQDNNKEIQSAKLPKGGK
jgi:large subunit ribosomal protein L24